MKPHPSRAVLQDGLKHMQAESGGAIHVMVVRPIDALGLLADAISGDAEARRLFDAVNQAATEIAAAPRRRPILCASCPRPLRRSAYSFVVALPARDNPTQALSMAVCSRCAVEPDAITAKAVTALRGLWPDLRAIAVTHETGGRA